MEKQKDEEDEDKVRGGGGAGEGCLVSSHKGRSAPLRTQRNQPATLTRNIHKPAPARAWNGERVAVGGETGGEERLLQDPNGLQNVRKLATRIRVNVLRR